MSPQPPAPSVVLGSTSRYRAELLRRLLTHFEQAAPDTDESPRASENAGERALRLAMSKAVAAAGSRRDTLVIGSDQVAELDGIILDKPCTIERAQAQLAASSGRSVQFHTGLCLLDTRSSERQVHLDITTVHFRELTAAEIERYIKHEQPLDCAGSFKCEGLGISLFDTIDNADPTALIGLPLMALARMLRAAGIALP
jgi:septum formation protein